MSAAKHTPGPWFENSSEVRAVCGRLDKPSLLIASVRAVDVTYAPELGANARLLAAAPELLSELDKAHQIILNALAVMTTEQKSRWAEMNGNNGIDGEGTTRYHERAAVIAKATGEAA